MQAQQAMRDSEKRYHSLYASMIEGMALHELVLDAQGQPQDYRILDVNPAFEGHTGMQRQAIVGRLASEAYGVPQAPFLANVAEVAQSGQPQVFDQFFQPLGKHFLISVFSPERLQFVTVFEDITERKRLEHELRDSEQRFRLLLEHTPSIAVQGYDTQRRVIFWNQASEQLYGYSAQEALGRQLEDLIIPDPMREFVIAATQAWMNGGPAIPATELTLRRKDGTAAPVFSSHAMQMGRNGPEMFCLDIDLSERKRAEAELERHRLHLEELVQERTQALAQAMDRVQRSEQRFQYALDATRDAIWDWNLQHNTSWLSPAYSAMLGYTPADLDERPEQHLRELLHPEDRDTTLAQMRQQLQDPGFYELEFRLRCQDGQLQVAAQPRQGRRARRRGPRAACGGHPHRPERAQGHGAGTAPCAAGGRGGHAVQECLPGQHEPRDPHAHERHPGADRADPAPVGGHRAERQAGPIAAAGQHLLGIIDDILDLSKIEAGKLVLEAGPLRIESIVGNVDFDAAGAGARQGAAPAEPGAGHPTGPGGRRHAAAAGAAELRQQCHQVHRRRPVTLSVEVLQDSEQQAVLRFEVADTGIGIAPDALQRLFGSFEQGDNSTTRRYGGTGLGLAITKRIAQLMQGDAGAETLPGRGSRFWFTVCLAKRSGMADPARPLPMAQRRATTAARPCRHACAGGRRRAGEPRDHQHDAGGSGPGRWTWRVTGWRPWPWRNATTTT
jgi:two-component system sensor histidine kinase/response regulator